MESEPQDDPAYDEEKIGETGMSELFFDFNDGDFAMGISDDLAIDSEGNLMMRMFDNMAMDMDTGDLHFISDWSPDKDEEDDFC